jgi:hypothetical protein
MKKSINNSINEIKLQGHVPVCPSIVAASWLRFWWYTPVPSTITYAKIGSVQMLSNPSVIVPLGTTRSTLKAP